MKMDSRLLLKDGDVGKKVSRQGLKSFKGF